MTLTIDGARPPDESPLDEPAADGADRWRWSADERRWILVIAVVAFVLRLAWLLYTRPAAPIDWMRSGDQYSYWYYGNEIAAGRGYVGYISHQPTAYYPIGYPAMLAVLFWVTIHTHLTSDLMLMVGLLHVAVSTASVVLVFVIGRRLLNPTVGLVAAGVLAIWPNVIFEVANVQLETMVVFVYLVPLAVLVTHDWSTGLPSRNRLIVFGLTLGVSVLVRPFSIWFLVGVFLAALAVRAGWKKALLATLVPTVVVVALQIPWTIRNEVRMHALIVTSTNTGDTLCLDRNMTAQGGFRWAAHDGCVDPNLPEVPRNSGNTRAAISFVVHHPAREVLQWFRRGKFEFREDNDALVAVDTLGTGPVLGPRTRDLLTSVSDWYFRVVLVLSVIGLVIVATKARKPERRIVLTAFVALLMVPILLWGTPRFHVPLVGILAICTAATIDAGARWMRRAVAGAEAGE